MAAQADEARRQSKLAIFAMQRDEVPQGKQKLEAARKLIQACAKQIKRQPTLVGESSWGSALEEYCEAHLFATYLDGKLSLPVEVENEPDVILGGLADLAGEIARHSVLRATVKDRRSLEKAHEIALKIVETLAALDLTGSLRAKFDQTKQHLRKIEDLRYDLSK